MRDHGLVESAASFGLHGHACWIYEDDDELIRGASEFLIAGERLGQRLIYAGTSLPEPLHGHAVDLLGLDELYGRADPEAVLARYSAATDAALADGYTGLRVVGEVSPLVCDPRDWERILAWEALADRYMAERPMAGLCCYDRRLVAEDVIDDLCAVHPAVRSCGQIVPFRLYRDGDALMLAGELDFFSADRLRRTLAAAAADGDVLDLRALRFTDHHGTVALLDSDVALRGKPNMMDRVCNLLRLEA
jgi:hypothetical protein